MIAPSTDKHTLDQRRAAHAWEAVTSMTKQIKQQPDKAKAFRGQAKKLPMRIMAAGLGHGLAFVREKGKAPELLSQIGDWVLNKSRNRDSVAPRPGESALLKTIIEKDALFLRRATDEVLAYLLWLNRFAAIELPDADDDD
ncbi:MAG: type III-B CRISPR module-associated protein Cmr5 [Rhodospirillales bacterium]|nr:type III-B CRISPR module-associated protein Cmr5 [Rhodospirillales bacterium]